MSKKNLTAKQKILEAAQDLMTKKGCNGVTIDDIADKVGVSKGHVTYYFSTKKDLVTAALEAHSLERDETYSSLYAAENLDDFFAKCIAMAQSQKTTSCLLGTVSQESNSLDEELRQQCCTLLNDWEGQLVQTFVRLLPEAKNQKALAGFFLAQLQGALLLAKAQRDPTILVSNLQVLHQMMQKLEE